jgi:hypothetical protein
MHVARGPVSAHPFLHECHTTLLTTGTLSISINVCVMSPGRQAVLPSLKNLLQAEEILDLETRIEILRTSM